MKNAFKALVAVCAMSMASGPSSASVIFSIDSDQTLKGTFSFSGLGFEYSPGFTNFSFVPTPVTTCVDLSSTLFVQRSENSRGAIRARFGFGCIPSDEPSRFLMNAGFSELDIESTYTTATGEVFNFEYSGFEDTGGQEGTFSGAFCFSSDLAACSVPEPTTTALLALGLFGVGAAARRRLN
jgi:hypothetical protein